MPFSMIITGYPTDNVPTTQVQGPAVQGMFLHLLEQVDPEVVKRLHANNRYRPYTLSPLGIGTHSRTFRGFRLPPEKILSQGTPCYLRVTLLEDDLMICFPRLPAIFYHDRNPRSN